MAVPKMDNFVYILPAELRGVVAKLLTCIW
jgi:hypothetical protein